MKLTLPLLVLAASTAAAFSYWPNSKPLPEQAADDTNLASSQSTTHAVKAEKTTPKPVISTTLPKATSPIPQEHQAPAEVVYRDGALSLNIQEQPLKSVLAEISAKTGLAINIMPGVGDENIAISLAGVFLEQALKSLLGQYDTFYLHGSAGKVDGVLRAVWVYPRGKGGQAKPLPPEQWASTSEFSMNLMDNDPEIRGKAIEELIHRQGKAALNNVFATLKDSDGAVRFRTLLKANNAGLEIPADTLLSLARQDTSVDVRATALRILLEQPNVDKKLVAEIAQYNLNDPDISMRHVAEDVLAQLTPHEEVPEAMVQ